MEKDGFYVNLDDPVGFRKEILLCTKEMLHALKTHERYKQMRAEKEKKITEFEGAVREIGRLNNKLRKLFPKSKLKKVSVPKPKKTADSKMEQIQEKLDKIEAKIGKLG